LGTKFSSLDELVARFAPFVTETWLLMPAAGDVKVGTEGRFIVQLADKQEVMSGRCVVEEIKGAMPGGSSRAVMRVGLRGMDEASRRVHERLLAARRPPPPPQAPPRPPPLRIVPAPTLIGPPPFVAASRAPLGAAVAAMPAAAAPSTAPAAVVPVPEAAPDPIAEGTIEATERSRWLAAETRAPSAALTLPANPLSELDAGDLASFIECTLFEASGDEPRGGEPADDQVTAGPELLASEDEARPPQAPPAAALPPDPPPMAGRAAPRVEDEDLPSRRPASLRLRLVQAAPYALCTVIGVLAGSLLRGSAPPARVPPSAELRGERPAAPAPPAPLAQTPPSAPSAPGPTAPAPAPAPAVLAPPPTAAAPPARGPARQDAPAAAGCFADVTTEPPDAVVLWGKRDLGRTPVRGARVACGAATVTLRHERYRDVERAVRAEPARSVVVSERLKRPPATLILASSPARATFTLNGEPVGHGPRVGVMRFEHFRVEATLPGYKPWTQTLYVKGETTRVSAQLVALAKPGAKPGPKGGGRGGGAARGDAGVRVDPFAR
jgi:hypothetical protein